MKISIHSLSVSRRLTRALALVAALIFGSLTVNATPVTVPNASFESPSSPASSSTNSTIIPGWVFSVKGGSAFGTLALSSNFTSLGASSGSDAAFINNDWPNVTDTITSAASLGNITARTDYTLTLALGNVKQSDSGLYGAPGNVSFSLLANGVAFATKTVNNGTVPNGTFQDFSLSFTTPASGSIIGDKLTIQIATLPEQGTAYKPVFDNITLDATVQAPPVVPEPSTWVLLLSGLLALCWRLRRCVA